MARAYIAQAGAEFVLGAAVAARRGCRQAKSLFRAPMVIPRAD